MTQKSQRMELADKDFRQREEREAETGRPINSRWDIAEGVNVNTQQKNWLNTKQKKCTEHQ